MSNVINKSIVMRVYSKGETYYLGSNRIGGVTLDDENYLPLVLQVGDAEKIGNFGEGFQVGSCSVTLLNGEQYHQGSYVFDMTNVWNNRRCEIRLCDVDNDSSWSDCEYYYRGIIKNLRITNQGISFDVDDIDYRDTATIPSHTTEDAIEFNNNISEDDIPEKNKGKRVPIQIGRLGYDTSGTLDRDEVNDGVFGKGILTSEKTGWQEIQFDTWDLGELHSIGVWEEGLRRYFEAVQKTPVSGAEHGEYEIYSGQRKVRFRLSAVTTLTQYVAANTGMDNFTVADWSKLQWLDETQIEESETYPELLSVNIIGIDSELMLLVNKPSSSTIYVERGFNNTDITSHDNNAPVFQSAKYAAKNQLFFQERFDAVATTNHYYSYNHTQKTPAELTFNGTLNNMTDNDLDSYFQINQEDGGGNNYPLVFTTDVVWPKISNSYTLINIYSGIKASWPQMTSSPHLALAFFSPGLESNPSDIVASNAPSTYNSNHCDIVEIDADGTLNANSINGYNTVQREPASLYAGSNNEYFPYMIFYISKGASGTTYVKRVDALPSTDLTDLNKKWKFEIYLDSDSDTHYVRIYKLALWAEFFADYTTRQIVGPVLGRHVDLGVVGITGATDGVLCENPVDVLTNMLIDSAIAGYVTTDFDTTTFTSIRSYYANTDIFPSIPRVAFSFGIDEDDEIWHFCQHLASHYMLMLTKKTDGTIGLVNLHRLQNTENTYGYQSLTHYKISIDDILIPGSERLLSIQQTGTDRIRNDVLIKYRRNNSSGDYQASYRVPDSYTMPISEITLSDARLRYYGGKKTETYTIESPFIYNAIDAQRLAEWHINDKAEVFFWATFTIDYEHYTQANGKSEQYAIGEVIYLDGVYSGISFDSTRPFVIRNVKRKDQGREMELQCKSMHPISEFTSEAEGQNDTYQDTINYSDIWQDTIDSTTIYQDKV